MSEKPKPSKKGSKKRSEKKKEKVEIVWGEDSIEITGAIAKLNEFIAKLFAGFLDTVFEELDKASSEKKGSEEVEEKNE